MSGRVSYMMPSHVAVLGDIAPRLNILLADVRRQYKRGEYGPPDERLLVFFNQLEQFAQAARQSQPSTFTPTGDIVDRWISTAEAAGRLEISERAVRGLRLTRKKVRGNLLWLESDVDAEVDVREWALRNPPEHSDAAGAA